MKKAQYGPAESFIFREAVWFLRKKDPLPAEEYKALSDECRAKAFTVTGYTAAEVLQRFLDELEEAAGEGRTKEEFAARMNDFLARNGYEGMNAAKASVVFETNIQTAYNAGHYKSMTDPVTKKLRPYWKYATAGDGAVRESHAQMEGRIYAADDPVWDIWYPPNGFRCRCTVVSMTKAQVERSGQPVSDRLPHRVDYGTGEILEYFPDKGFSNNPAKTAWKPDLSGMDPAVRSAFEAREKKKRL